MHVPFFNKSRASEARSTRSQGTPFYLLKHTPCPPRGCAFFKQIARSDSARALPHKARTHGAQGARRAAGACAPHCGSARAGCVESSALAYSLSRCWWKVDPPHCTTHQQPSVSKSGTIQRADIMPFTGIMEQSPRLPPRKCGMPRRGLAYTLPSADDDEIDL